MSTAGMVTAEVMVEKTVYAGSSYVVVGARRDDGSYVRVRTPKLMDLIPGETWRVTGEEQKYRDPTGAVWTQVVAATLDRVRLSGLLVGKWLERLPNVGPKRAERLMLAFGADLGKVLSDVKNLAQVAAALDPKKPVLASRIAAQIFTAMSQRSTREITAREELAFLTKLESLGVTDNRAARALWRLVGGAGSTERLTRNPYLAASILPWVQADHVGQRLLAETVDKAAIADHPSRLLGAVDTVWKEVLADGDTAAYPARFKTLLSCKVVAVDRAIALAIEKGRIRHSGGLFRAPGAAWLEDRLAAKLKALETNTAIDAGDFQVVVQLVEEAQRMTDLTLYEEQACAVQMLLALPVAVLQGGAGVGKTTVMKVLVAAWESLGGNVVMGALAGKAALQLMRGTSSPGKPRLAYTVARMLGMLEDDGNKKPQDAVRFDSKTLLILDEASMLDTPSLHQLVSHLPAGARLLLVGDEGQLPPVGIGRVFHDLVAEGSRVVSLTTVRRQGAQSTVPAAAAAIRAGQVPQMQDWQGQDGGGVFILRDKTKVQQLYAQLAVRSQDLMVVAAKKTTVGIFNERASTQQRLTNNGDTHSIRLGPLASVATGDHVVCTRNRYQDGLFNGLLGRVTEASLEFGISVLWDGEEEPRIVTAEIGADMELAYAITCHRAQGSAAQYVIVMVEDSPLVTREWVYTAVTRTRDTVILVGDDDVLAAALTRRMQRVTGFTI